MQINNPNPNILLEEVPKPSKWEYLKIRIGMKLYKCGIVKGWDYDFVTGKTTFHIF